MDCERNERERTKERKSEAKRRQTQWLLPCRRARPRTRRGAHGCRRSTAAFAKGTFVVFGATSGQASWDVACPLSGRTHPRLFLSPASSSHPGHSAEGLMPKAARERVASPPAGTALARAIWECLPGRVRKGRGSELYVTETGTYVNEKATSRFRHCRAFSSLPDLIRQSMRRGRTCGDSVWTTGSSPVVTRGPVVTGKINAA
jgi:hypothetical protein